MGGRREGGGKERDNGKGGRGEGGLWERRKEMGERSGKRGGSGKERDFYQNR